MFAFIESVRPFRTSIFGEPIVDLWIDYGVESMESDKISFDKLVEYLLQKQEVKSRNDLLQQMSTIIIFTILSLMPRLNQRYWNVV